MASYTINTGAVEDQAIAYATGLPGASKTPQAFVQGVFDGAMQTVIAQAKNDLLNRIMVKLQATPALLVQVANQIGA